MIIGTRRVLEFGVGTGRLAVPLAERGVPVASIELSPAMAARICERSAGRQVDVTIGDPATTRVDGVFGLVYLARNTITNLTTQAEQVAAFRNAAVHLGRLLRCGELRAAVASATAGGPDGRIGRADPV